MTRKDFQRIASVIAAKRQAAIDYVSHPRLRDRLIAIDELANDLADMLAISNPRFNRALFLKACNVPDSQENLDE